MVAALRRRPARPPVGEPTLDLGPEPPAIVNFLTNGFRVTRDAVPATLLDLAARKVVELEHRGPDEFVCRLDGDPGGLTPYEQRIVALLRKNASGGVVPAEALTTGPAGESSRWWTDFRREVIDDARGRGLSREILDKKLLSRLLLAAIVPALLLGKTFGSTAGFVCFFGAFGLLSLVWSRHTQRETPAGLEAASRWLGVREQLHEDEVFPTLPPITVGIWERHLAYGAALGVAPGAVRPIPMGAESDRRAWSAYGGHWHSVEIAYPDRLGWGLHPLAALLRAAVTGALSCLMLYLLAGPLLSGLFNLSGWPFAISAVILLVPGLVAASAALVILRALADLGSPVEVIGEVLRRRTFGSGDKLRRYLAVDDGRSTKVHAWIVGADIYERTEQHDVVTATVTRHLRHVRAIRTEPAG